MKRRDVISGFVALISFPSLAWAKPTEDPIYNTKNIIGSTVSYTKSMKDVLYSRYGLSIEDVIHQMYGTTFEIKNLTLPSGNEIHWIETNDERDESSIWYKEHIRKNSKGNSK